MRVTIRHVAERAGVSIATVSRVLNDKDDVRAATRKRVHEAATELGYSVDSVGRALASQRTRLVGVVVGDNAGHRDLSLMFFGKVLSSISRRLAQLGYEPLLLQDADAGGAHRFDAAIVIGIDEDDPVLLELAERAVPVVGVDVRCGGEAAAFVGSDHAGEPYVSRVETFRAGSNSQRSPCKVSRSRTSAATRSPSGASAKS